MRTFGTMYLRPGNLWKSFRIKRQKTANVNGHSVESYEDTDQSITGVLAEAEENDRERTKHMWNQAQHSLTHTLVIRGKTDARKGDMLTCDERAFIVLYNDDIGALGYAGLIYLEERNDIK